MNGTIFAQFAARRVERHGDPAACPRDRSQYTDPAGLRIRPVVLVRRIYDIVLSISDFNDNGAITNTFYGDVWPTLDQSAKYDLIIDHVMPWYASFYASWELAARHRKLDCLFVTYEDMIADKPSAIAAIADYLGLGMNAEKCAAAVQAVGQRRREDTVQQRGRRPRRHGAR